MHLTNMSTYSAFLPPHPIPPTLGHPEKVAHTSYQSQVPTSGASVDLDVMYSFDKTPMRGGPASKLSSEYVAYVPQGALDEPPSLATGMHHPR